MLVRHDVDIENIERANVYHGKYFVIGNLEKPPLDHLLRIVHSQKPIEIVLALPANPEGDYTSQILRDALAETKIPISTLGRGLSTGTELEYADGETLRAALTNRRSVP